MDKINQKWSDMIQERIFEKIISEIKTILEHKNE